MPKSKKEREDAGRRLATSPTPTAFGCNLFRSSDVAMTPDGELCPTGCGGTLRPTCSGKECGKCGWSAGWAAFREAEMIDCTNCGRRMPRNGECPECGAVAPLTDPWED